MQQENDSIEFEDWTAMEWLHIPEGMIACLRPIWEGYPKHPARIVRLGKGEKKALSSVGLGQTNEVKEHFSVDGKYWKKRRDEALQAFIGDYHLS